MLKIFSIIFLNCIFDTNSECISRCDFCCYCFEKVIKEKDIKKEDVDNSNKNDFSNDVNISCNKDEFYCGMCMGFIPNEEKFYTCNDHYFCKDCVFTHIKESTKGSSIIKCPECENIMKIEAVFGMLNNNMLNDNVEENQNLIKQIKKHQYISEVFRYPDIGLCMYKDCTGVIDTNKNDCEYFSCDKDDGHKHCKKCYDIIHKGPCKEIDNKDILNAIAFNENIVNIYKKRKNEIEAANVPYGFVNHNDIKTPYTCGFKPCPSCGRLIYKDGGCNALQCGRDFVAGKSEYNIGCNCIWCWRCGKQNYFYYVGTKWVQHYDDPNDECYNMRHQEQKSGHERDFSDGNYFGIMNGNYVKHFKIYYKKLKKIEYLKK